MSQDGRAALLAHAFGHARNVDEDHVGGRVLLGHKQCRQFVEPLVGHLDHSHVGLGTRVAADIGMLVGERVEQRGLTGAGQTRDTYLHVSGQWSVISGQLPSTASRR